MHVHLLDWRSPCLVAHCCVQINRKTPCRTSGGCNVHTVSQKQAGVQLGHQRTAKHRGHCKGCHGCWAVPSTCLPASVCQRLLQVTSYAANYKITHLMWVTQLTTSATPKYQPRIHCHQQPLCTSCEKPEVCMCMRQSTTTSLEVLFPSHLAWHGRKHA